MRDSKESISNTPVFSIEQLEYIKRIHNGYNNPIEPDSKIESIMYNSGIAKVITSIEARTQGLIPKNIRST